MLGWGYAFLAAGVGMVIGVIVFIVGTRHYKDADVIKGVREGEMSFTRILFLILFPSLIAGILGWLINGVTTDSNPGGNILVVTVPMLLFLHAFRFCTFIFHCGKKQLWKINAPLLHCWPFFGCHIILGSL